MSTAFLDSDRSFGFLYSQRNSFGNLAKRATCGRLRCRESAGRAFIARLPHLRIEWHFTQVVCVHVPRECAAAAAAEHVHVATAVRTVKAAHVFHHAQY